MKRLSILFTLLAAFSLLTASAAQAAVVEKATGSITMSDPNQAITFAVFEDPMKGSLTYTNFEYPDPGSGVWVPGATFDVGFGVDPSPAVVATYAFAVTSWQVTSPNSLTFEGVGDGPDPWYGDFEGSISGSTFSFTLLETDGVDTFTLNATGTIDAFGAVIGTWNDDYPSGLPVSRTGTFAIADVGDEVFSFTTSPTCVKVMPDENAALFGYVIPAGAPAELAYQSVVVLVSDNGSPGAGNDTFKHTFGTCATHPQFWEYPIVSGNLVVHPADAEPDHPSP